MPLDPKHRERLARADDRLIQLAKDIKVLSLVGWPSDLREEFLSGWRAGQPKLPQPEYPRVSLGSKALELERLASDLDEAQPLEAFLMRTARSYASVCAMLDRLGTREFGERSIGIYGKPRDPLHGGGVTSLEAAEHFAGVSKSYAGQFAPEEGQYCIPAETVQEELTRRLEEALPGGRVTVVVDPSLSAKAAAGATRIRLRGATCFSRYDVDQLLQHEAFVHSLTALNGRDQPLIKSLGLGAPRTTAAQEGLATFAELVTGAIDIARCERLARRVLMTDMALSGANFIEVFEAFLETGQTEDESYFSTMRLFRGVPTSGGSAFTKDTVYLRGLLEVHTFFRWALREGHMDSARRFLSGRMTPSDALELAGSFESGDLVEARCVPPWMQRGNGLAGYLAFSLFANAIRLEDVGRHYAEALGVGSETAASPLDFQ